MMVKSARIAIIGGGLSGLYAAALLEERGIKDYVVLEARETFGGRIISVPDVSGPGWDKVGGRLEIGRASCREKVCQYVWISVVAVSSKKKTKKDKMQGII